MKWFKTCAVGTAFLISATAFAAHHDHAKQDHSTQQLKLYKKPNKSSKAITQIKLNDVNNFVPFHRQGDWVKVGDRQSGQVGWINEKSYHQLAHKASEPKVNMRYVYTKDDHGKPKVYAFENGHKLSKKEAKKMYQQMQKQMKQQEKQFRKQWRKLNHQFIKLNEQFSKMFSPSHFWLDVPFDDVES